MLDLFRGINRDLDLAIGAAKTVQRAAKLGARAGDHIGRQQQLGRDREYLIKRFGAGAFDEIRRRVQTGEDLARIVAEYDARHQQAKELAAPPPLDGSARWASWQDLKQVELVKDPDHHPDQADLFLGAFLNPDPTLRARPDNWLYWNGDGHLVTVAPTGAGKSALQLINNLLRYQGSCVVLDPKGELYRATSWYREKLGKVYRLAPFEEKTDAFNPLDMVQGWDDAQELALLIYPDESPGDGRFYEGEARSFLTALLYFLANTRSPELRTLHNVRRLTMLPVKQLQKFLQQIADDPRQPDALRDTALLFTEQKPEVMNTLKRSLNEKLQLWESDALRRATAHSDFTFGDLKRETITVYLTVPFHRMESLDRYLRVMLTAALEAMVATPERPKAPILFILDEFLRLGPFPRFVHALRTHRDAGVRLWFIMQSLADIREHYRDNWPVFFANASVKSYFGLRDHDTARQLSEVLGQFTMAYQTTQVGSSLSQTDAVALDPARSTGGSSITQTVAYKGRPLMDAREIQRVLGHSDPNGTRHVIHEIAGQDPVRGILVPWYAGSDLLCRFGDRDLPLTPSPGLISLWERFNGEFFGGLLAPIDAIGTVDYSMGRDGYLPGKPDMRAHYEAQFNRIILIAASQPVIDVFERDDPSLPEELKDLAFGYLAPLLVHEMMHQETIARTGKIREDHGPEFLQTAKAVFAQMQARAPAWEWPEPTAQTVANWPPMPQLSNVLPRMPPAV